MDWIQIISLVCNVVFGGGFIAAMVTLKSTKQKAAAEVDTLTIGNTKEIVELWREYSAVKSAEDKAQFEAMTNHFKQMLEEKEKSDIEKSKQIDALTKEVAKLNRSQKKILELLNKISHENLEQIVGEIKEEVKKDA